MKQINKFNLFTHLCAGVSVIITTPLIYKGLTSALSFPSKMKSNISFRQEEDEDYEEDEFDLDAFDE